MRNQLKYMNENGLGVLGSPYKPLIAVTAIGTWVMLLTLILYWQLNIPIEKSTADPAATFQAHPFTGYISNLGVLLWCSSAVVCLFTYMLFRIHKIKSLAIYFLSSGLLCSLLLFDDFFMLHEFILPRYLGISQTLVYVIYLVPVLFYMFYFREEILNSEYEIFIIATILLSLSVVGDNFLPQEGMSYFIEDSFKFIGIAIWTLYFFRLCIAAIIGAMQKPKVKPS